MICGKKLQKQIFIYCILIFVVIFIGGFYIFDGDSAACQIFILIVFLPAYIYSKVFLYTSYKNGNRKQLIIRSILFIITFSLYWYFFSMRNILYSTVEVFLGYVIVFFGFFLGIYTEILQE